MDKEMKFGMILTIAVFILITGFFHCKNTCLIDLAMEKYIAIKVDGIKHWLWFEETKVERDTITFKGTNGWGKRGELITTFKCDESLIQGELTSPVPQY